MIIIALITIKRELATQFREYEQQAATIMASYGGRFEKLVIIHPGAEDPIFQELHILNFPSSEAWAAYKWDACYRELAPLRERVVLETEVMIGDNGPLYGT